MGEVTRAGKVREANGGRLRGENGRYVPREKPTLSEEEKAELAKKPRLRPRDCAEHLRRELAGSFRTIVRGFVKQAESGSVPHVKLATEILQRPAVKKKAKGSAQKLLEELEQMGTVAEPEDVWRE